MAKARIEADVRGFEEGARKLGQVDQAVGKLNDAQRKGTITAKQLEKSTAALARQQAKLKKATRQAAEATKVMTQRAQQMKAGQAEAATKAVLLGQQIGVTLPTAMQRLVTSSEGLQKVIGATFAVSAIVFFAQALAPVGRKMREILQGMRGINTETQELRAELEALNRIRFGEATSEQIRATIEGLETEQSRIKEFVEQLEKAQRGLAEFPKSFSGATFVEDIRFALGRIKEIPEEIKKGRKELRAALAKDFRAATLEEQVASTRAAEQRIAQAKVAFGKIAQFQKTADDARVGSALDAEGKINFAVVRTSDQILALIKEFPKFTKEGLKAALAVIQAGNANLAEFRRQQGEKELAQAAALNTQFEAFLRTQNALIFKEQAAGLKGIERIRFEAGLRNRGIERQFAAQLKVLRDSDLINVTQKAAAEIDLNREKARVIEAIERGTQRRIAEFNEQAFEKMAQDIEAFIDRVFLTARSFADVWRQLIGQMVSQFVKGISRMVAEWVTGMRRMEASAAIGGRNLFGNLLGGLFGGGAAAAIQPQAAAASTITAGGGLSNTVLSDPVLSAAAPAILAGPSGGAVSVGGSGGGGIPTAAGGATAATAQRAAVLSQLQAFGLLGTGLLGAGLTKSAFLSGGPGKGFLGGALLGGTIATTIGLLSGFSFLGAASLFGPIGLLLGGLTGLILGISGRGRAKNRAAGLQQDIIDRAIAVVDAFKRHQLQFAPAIAQLEALRAQGIDTIRQSRLGSAGRRAIDFVSSDIDQKIRKVTGIQRQREATLQLLQGFTLPEFLHGGAVNGRAIQGPNGILSILHPGEFVLKKEAVQAMGESLLSGFNRSPRQAVSGGGGGGGLVVNQFFTINAFDADSTAKWWRRNQGNMVRTWKKAVADRAF